MCPRILVVDDDLAALALLHDILAPEGYRVACASTADAGLRAVRQECPALILLDLRLETPDAGWRLLERLRAAPATAAVPIIVCSADCRALRERADELRSRRCATLPKPFSLADLLGHVALALRPPAPPEQLCAGDLVETDRGGDRVHDERHSFRSLGGPGASAGGWGNEEPLATEQR